jgi:squalene synthase HpnC
MRKNVNTPPAPNPILLSEAYAHCANLTKAHYENFPVGSLLIPKQVRPHVHAIYAFARTADDIADEPGLSKPERLAQLKNWKDKLDTCHKSPDGPIFTALAHTIHTQQIPIQLLKDLLTAFLMDVEHDRHETLDELHHYCTYSANPVGRLILHLFGYHSAQVAHYSDAICTALQLANFWQDIAIDFSRNRIYLPKTEMQNFGVSEEDLQQKRVTPHFKALLTHLIQHTEKCFQSGKPLLSQVHGRLRYELRLTWLGGREILNKIQQNDFDIFHHRPKLQKNDLSRILYKAFWPFYWRT